MTIPDAFCEQAAHCARLQAAFTQRLCEILATGLSTAHPVERSILQWTGNPAPLAGNLPLRVAGALHAIVRAGKAPALAALYPPAPLPAPDVLLTAARQALANSPEIVAAYLASPPQTNEVGRSAPLLAGWLVVAERTGLPLALWEIGASAGLNLVADQYRYRFGPVDWGRADAAPLLQPEWSGNPPPTHAPLVIRSRQSCDLQPVSIHDAAQRERLMSYIWPDQPDRLARLSAALATAAGVEFAVERAHAADWLERSLPVAPLTGTTRVLYHSVFWNYLDTAEQSRLERHIAAVGAAARADAPFAWLRLELVHKTVELKLTLWPAATESTLATCHPHGATVQWHGENQ